MTTASVIHFAWPILPYDIKFGFEMRSDIDDCLSVENMDAGRIETARSKTSSSPIPGPILSVLGKQGANDPGILLFWSELKTGCRQLLRIHRTRVDLRNDAVLFSCS